MTAPQVDEPFGAATLALLSGAALLGAAISCIFRPPVGSLWLTSRVRYNLRRYLIQALGLSLLLVSTIVAGVFLEGGILVAIVTIVEIAILRVVQRAHAGGFLTALARIPQQRDSLALRMQNGALSIPESAMKAAKDEVLAIGFKEFKRAGSVLSKQLDEPGEFDLGTFWAQSVALLSNLDAHRSSLSNAECLKLEAVRTRHFELAARTARLSELATRLKALGIDAQASRVSIDLKDSPASIAYDAFLEARLSYRNAAREFSSELLLTLSSAMLRLGRGAKRNRLLQGLGLTLGKPQPSAAVGGLFFYGLLVALGLFSVLLASPLGGTVYERLVLVARIGLSQALAILFALSPKLSWAFATRFGRSRPYGGYVAAAALTALTWVLLFLVEQIALRAPLSLEALRFNLPFALLPVTTAIACAFMADSFWSDDWRNRSVRLRCLEGAILGALLAVQALVVARVRFGSWDALPTMVVLLAMFGASVGLVVPEEWRKRTRGTRQRLRL